MTLSFPHASAGGNASRLSVSRTSVILGVSAFALLVAANASFYRVRQNEVGYLTRFGKVVNPEAGPLQPGLHFKLPFVDEPDTLSVSTDTRSVWRR